jgi:hypothetical protein
MLSSAKAIFEFFALTEEQAKVLGEKVLDFANIGSGALIFGSALSEGRIKWSYLISGMLLWVFSFVFYLILTNQRGKKNA